MKTAGQIAYEKECESIPVYHDKTPRKTWAELSDIARWSWDRKPTPRGQRTRFIEMLTIPDGYNGHKLLVAILWDYQDSTLIAVWNSEDFKDCHGYFRLSQQHLDHYRSLAR